MPLDVTLLGPGGEVVARAQKSFNGDLMHVPAPPRPRCDGATAGVRLGQPEA